jgi:hypothetical protein
VLATLAGAMAALAAWQDQRRASVVVQTRHA